MSINRVSKPYNAKRRIQLLFAFSVFLIIAATGGWYFVAGKIDGAAENFLAKQSAKGNEIACDNKTVRGYPFRFGVFCDAVTFNNRADGSVWKTGAFRSAAQFYNLRKIVGEVDGPLVIQPRTGGDITIDWASMRSFLIVAKPLPERFSLVGKQVRIKQNGAAPVLSASGLEGYMRINGNDLDLAGKVIGFKIKNSIAQLDNLPLLGMDFDVAVKDGVTFLTPDNLQLRGSNLDVRRIGLLLSDDQGVLISGPVVIDDNGLIDGELDVRIIDVDAVFKLLGRVLPNIMPLMSTFAEGQPRTGEKNDEISMKVSIEKSQIRLGFIPIAKLKPIAF